MLSDDGLQRLCFDQAMSSQALNSQTVRDGIQGGLLNYTNLYEDLRVQGLKD